MCLVLDEEHVDQMFIYSHCATTHSSQGASINTSITLHEWDKSYLVSRELFAHQVRELLILDWIKTWN